MNVICMVPSWTETLIECGVNVVGRTRFCIHPQDHVKTIAVVGGTKDIQWDKVRELKADLLILDREENLPFMKEESPILVHVTHVEKTADMILELGKFAELFPDCASAFLDLQKRWQVVLGQKASTWDFSKVPAMIESLDEAEVLVGVHTKPSREGDGYLDSKSVVDGIKKIVYVIWRKPWMTVSGETWIGSVLKHLGAEKYLMPAEKKYPEFELEQMDLQKTYFLFSSEPFPFHKKIAELRELGVRGAIVDGESYSWFGVRSLRFLEGLAGG